MNKSQESGREFSKLAPYIRHAGVALCLASVIFALSGKGQGPVYVILFWICFAILMGVSMGYLVIRRRSERWRSEAMRSCFSPYLMGATIWLFLMLLLTVLYWLP